MKALVLTRYSEAGASSRYRSYQYKSHLLGLGIEWHISPLLDDAYLAALYETGRKPLLRLIPACVRRLRVLLTARQYDLVVVEKELFPYCPGIMESVLLRGLKAYSLDFDDALFHLYDSHHNFWVRRCLAHKFRPLLRHAKLTTVANPYISRYCEQYASNVNYLPTVLDLEKYSAARQPNGPFTIGWIGTPVSARNLSLVVQPLRQFLEHHEARVLLIGAGQQRHLEGLATTILPWEEGSEIECLSQMHIGIMPLADEPMERGKSGLKLLQYLACGRPVIASPVGVNKTIVTSDVGFLADSPGQWLESLERLYADPTLRERLGGNGKRMVAEQYDLRSWSTRYAMLMMQATGDTGSNSSEKGGSHP